MSVEPRLALPRNRLLLSLPPSDYNHIAPQLAVVPLRAGKLLVDEAQPVQHVLFPHTGTCSLIKTMRNGETAELATIGNEGAIGIHAYFGQLEATAKCVVRGAGEAWALSVEEFTAEMDRRSAFYNVVIRYNQALTNQIMQTTACNGLHSVKKRCCRWLLSTHDREEGDEFRITHDFLAAMLGVRRPTVSLVVASMQKEGLIRAGRGRVMVLNRAALELASCECYETVTRSFSRLLPEVSSAG